ncbi:MAG: bifunctional 3,4-dihydroxy-2-butanone-4-phosphate synthase/GTP cyclohydrolase [Conexibacter sp.]|nr:bifunctional 3,4-dihydroxy-2-butanone-4-phosphate synthase/GTP cyclohydrolase [Conexibacter sp.]
MTHTGAVAATAPLRDRRLERVGSAPLPTRFGELTLIVYQSDATSPQHFAAVCGDVAGRSDVITRVHSECRTGDVFGSLRCDCGEQLDRALQTIGAAGTGVLVYLAQEGRGIGLLNKLRAYALQEQGLDTVDANLALGFAPDLRDYGVAADILHDLGMRSIRLLTNNPQKVTDLRASGVRVSARVPLAPAPNAYNEAYLRTKFDRMGHRRPLSTIDCEPPCG